MDKEMKEREELSPRDKFNDKFKERFSVLDGRLGKSIREGSKLSWGVIILLAGALYALINFSLAIIRLFN